MIVSDSLNAGTRIETNGVWSWFTAAPFRMRGWLCMHESGTFVKFT